MRVDEFSHLYEARSDGLPVAVYGLHTLRKLATMTLLPESCGRRLPRCMSARVSSLAWDK